MSYAQPARRTATLGATSTNSWRALLLSLALLLTTACGGGGGDGGGHGSASSAAALNRYGPVLEPDAPLRTSAESYILSGEVNAEYTRGDNCESDGPSQETIMRLRWRNTTTGANGTSDVILACRPSGTIVGPYVFHVWSTGPVQLALGDNVFELDTYDDGQQIGSQRVTVLRHDGIAPTVAYRYPVDGAVDVPTNHVIQVQFSEAMDPSSLLDANLTLLDASANPLTGTYEYNATHRTWTLQPTSLLTPGETYRVTLSGSLRDAYGIEMAGDLVWHFTAGASADTTAPVLLARRPENTCYCDPGAVVLSATFGEPLDPDSVTAETFFVTDDVGEEVSGSIEVSGDRIEFRPAADYIHGRVYQATVAAGVRDANGYATNGQASWSFRFDPQQPFGAWQEAWRSEQPTYGVTSVWDGMEFHFWGETSGPYKDPSECAADDAACQDEFVTRALGRSFNGIDTTITGIADSPLRHPSLVWTGREVLRYGGSDAAGPVARSQRFDPMVGAWENTSGYWPEDGVHYFLKGLVNHSAIWTGSEMIVWGGSRRLDGVTNRGWRYDPARDQWSITGPLPSIDASLRLIEDPNAPTARQHHAAAWTGTEMFIFGGRDGGGKPLRDAAAYNPATNTWRTISDSPSGGLGAVSAVWTGTRVIVWDGGQDVVLAGDTRQAVSSVQQYDPVADTWTVSHANWGPKFLPELGAYFAFWTGEAMLAVGVESFTANPYQPDDGQTRTMRIGTYRYHPAGDYWTEGTKLEATSDGVHPVREAFTAAWAGDRVLVFDGQSLYTFTP